MLKTSDDPAWPADAKQIYIVQLKVGVLRIDSVQIQT